LISLSVDEFFIVHTTLETYFTNKKLKQMGLIAKEQSIPDHIWMDRNLRKKYVNRVVIGVKIRHKKCYLILQLFWVPYYIYTRAYISERVGVIQDNVGIMTSKCFQEVKDIS
jgi:hypothetical protein